MKTFIYPNNSLSQLPMFEIYFNYNCNYNCSYCFVPHENKYMIKSKLELLIKRFNELKTPVIIKILGGEPLLYPYLIYFINKISDIHHIELTTNFSKNIEKLKGIKRNNIRFSLSIHYEYLFKDKEKYVNNLLNILNIINDFKNKTIVEIIFNIYKSDYNIKYSLIKQEYYNLMKLLKKKNYSNIELNIVLGSIIFKNIYTLLDEDYEFFKEFLFSDTQENYYNQKYILEDKDNKKTISYIDLFELLLNKYNFNFKNKCICYMNLFKIDIDLNLYSLCFDDKIGNLIQSNIFDKIKNYKKICNKDKCDYGCYFDVPKLFFKN